MTLHTILTAAGEATPGGSDVKIAIFTLIGIVITAIFSYMAARYNARQATKASSKTTSVTERQVDVNEWKDLVGSLSAEVKRLGQRVDDLEKKDDTNRQRIETLEGAVRSSDTKYRVALTYIKDVIAWTKTVLHTDAVPPTAPIDIQTDLNQH